MSSPYGSPHLPQGSPNETPGRTPHGGDHDPIGLYFDTEDGVPTQAIPRPYAANPTQSTVSSSSIQTQRTSGITRVPVGARAPEYNNAVSYATPKEPATSYVTEVYPTPPTPGWTNNNSYQPAPHGPEAYPSPPTPAWSSTTHQQSPNPGMNSNFYQTTPYGQAPEYQSSDMHDVEFDADRIKENTTYRVPRTHLKGYLGNFFSFNARYRLVSPRSIQKSGCNNIPTEKSTHRDSLQRLYEAKGGDKFLNPIDGRLKDLVVQCTDKIYRGPKNSTYHRTFIRNVAPLTLRVANWPMDHFDNDSNGKGSRAWALVMLVKWPIACFVLNHMIGIPGVASTGKILNGGGYDPFPYRYWGYCKVTRNVVEDSGRSSFITAPHSSSVDAVVSDIESNRMLEPVALCFLTEDQGRLSTKRQRVSDWKTAPENQHHHGKCPEYLFVAYTTEHFTDSPEDTKALHAIAVKATKAAGLTAYWVSVSCMEKGKTEDSVFRISDVVRGAHSLVIAIGSGPAGIDEEASMHCMLQQWGSRLWTLPEVLLATPHRPITVYRRGNQEPFSIPKNQFAILAWADSATSRQLIDHYEGNLALSRLELVIIAMQSLFARTRAEYLEGDHSYALMGLLRLRPKIDRTDTAFQAFARLSLANDSDKLLERLMCILPQDQSQEWHSVSDAFGVNVWDIYPTCQIAGVCEEDTVLVDGAFGATIHWDQFRKVANTRRVKTVKRMAAQYVLHGAPYVFTAGMVMYRAALDTKTFMNGIQKVSGFAGLGAITVVEHWAFLVIAVGYILIGIGSVVFMFSPWLTRVLYRGKFWGTQAWLFGFEGHADLETIESQIFGSRMHRLRWSTYGSSLSRQCKNGYNECVGVDPTTDSVVYQKVEDAMVNTRPDAMRIFTLVDTNTMTVTMFEAVKPPVAVLLCGTEGGMQRAIACSYEWTKGICYRETVLRMETTVLEKMSRVARFRLGIKRV